jgi:outer membrane translocation and assembly module TamA
VSNCNADPCTSFLVGTQAVQVNTGTRFENGSAVDLANGARVEAEGHVFTGSTLVAEKVTFKRTRVILNGIATVTGSIPGTGTLVVLGKTVQTNSLTQFDASAGVVTTGERVEVRGFIDGLGTIVAERVDDTPSGGNKDSVQARVTVKVGNVLTLLVGTTTIDADLTNATQFSDTNEQPIPTLTAFLAAVTAAPAPGGTLVKVKGTFSTGTIAVDEAELEN